MTLHEDTPPRFLTIDECAVLLRCHGNTIRRHVRTGRLPGKRVFQRYLIDRKGIDKLIGGIDA